MANTYTWAVNELLTVPSPPGPINEYVVIALYTVTATDGTVTAKTQSSAQFTENNGQAHYVPYSELTEATVIGWIQALPGVVENIQANLDNQIKALINPPVLPTPTPLPW
jgi:hypothetical protein